MDPLTETPAAPPPLEPDHRVARLRSVALVLSVGVAALVAVFLIGLRLGAFPWNGATTGALRPGDSAPDFALQTPQGGMIRLDELRGTPVWLTFWASWCPPCRVEMPDTQALFEASQPGRYHYLAINIEEDAVTASTFLRGGGYTFPAALDVTGEVSLSYGVMALPTHVFVDKDGTVREVYVGILSRSQMADRLSSLW